MARLSTQSSCAPASASGFSVSGLRTKVSISCSVVSSFTMVMSSRTAFISSARMTGLVFVLVRKPKLCLTLWV